MVVLGSIVRNGVAYLANYFWRCERLWKALNGGLHVILLEGDSTDGTKPFMEDVDYPWLTKLELNLGNETFGHVDHPARWLRISKCANKVLEAIPASAEKFIWVETDIIWAVDSMVDLLDCVSEKVAVAPMILAYGTNRFYDVWGFRELNGACFSAFPPYYRGWPAQGLYEIQSAGSCIVMPAWVARAARYPTNPVICDGIVGWCRDIRLNGVKLFLKPDVTFYHPNE